MYDAEEHPILKAKGFLHEAEKQITAYRALLDSTAHR